MGVFDLPTSNPDIRIKFETNEVGAISADDCVGAINRQKPKDIPFATKALVHIKGQPYDVQNVSTYRVER